MGQRPVKDKPALAVFIDVGYQLIGVAVPEIRRLAVGGGVPDLILRYPLFINEPLIQFVQYAPYRALDFNRIRALPHR